jgi:predicted nucleic acid-binding protein
LLQATALCRTHALRAYDAVQLASALVVNDDALAYGTGPILFVSADTALLAAAAIEGLLVDNPLAH